MGDLLAELTTEDDEALDSRTEPGQASAFRIVTNMVQPNGQEA